jgi:hypothetical protein
VCASIEFIVDAGTHNLVGNVGIEHGGDRHDRLVVDIGRGGGLFSVAPMNSARVWIDGIVFSIVFGWAGAVILGLVYNRLMRQ